MFVTIVLGNSIGREFGLHDELIPLDQVNWTNVISPAITFILLYIAMFKVLHIDTHAFNKVNND